MKKGLVGAVVLLVVALFAVWLTVRQVPVTWRLVPVQQSVILPPGPGSVTLAPGGVLVQYFTPPARSSGVLMLDFISFGGSAPPDVRVLLRNAAGRPLISGYIPSAYVAAHTASLQFADPQAGLPGRYSLALAVPATAGSAGRSVSIAAADAHPRGSALLVAGRPYPATLGITISYDVPLGTYLGRYASMLLSGRAIGWSLSIAAFHLLWLAGMAAMLVVAAIVVLHTLDGPEEIQAVGTTRRRRKRRQASQGASGARPAWSPTTAKRRRA